LILLALLCGCSDSSVNPSADSGAPNPKADSGIPQADASPSADTTVIHDSSTLKPDLGGSSAPEETKLDQVFRQPGGKSIAGDLYLPARSAPVPAVIQIHGGGFSAGDKAGKAETIWCDHLRKNGFAAFSVNYRVYSDFAAGETPFPAAVMDIKCAIMWLRKNSAKLMIDPNNIFVLGGSAGGFMTNFVGTTGDVADFTPTDCLDGNGESNRVAGAVTYYGPADWNAMFNDPARVGTLNGEKKFIGDTSDPPCAPGSAEASGICAYASATTYADAQDPPFYISHSDDDPVVPVGQGRLMKSVLEQAKVNVTYHEVTGLKHGWHANFKDTTATMIRDEVTAWLKAQVK
jgi:acetyl esterase/lipase